MRGPDPVRSDPRPAPTTEADGTDARRCLDPAATSYGAGWSPTGHSPSRGGGCATGIEQQTEAALAPVLDAIGPALPTLTRRLDEWSTAIVTGGAAPPDVYRRISG
ncbi:hypothetical protein ACI79G_04190 [Geodermatophilus sp. SYSU D00779]